MIAFGPVPSRRLGRSLGVNNVTAKSCTYSCVYCQVGRTPETEVERREYFMPEEIFRAVRKKVQETRERDEAIDFITFVPDGEPTLDIHLGAEIDLLRTLGIKLAVISNASLIWREDVRKDLKEADWVSFKVDSTKEEIWRRINQPHINLRLPAILEGLLTFAETFHGELTTETMLVKGVNDDPDSIKEVSEFISRLRPRKAYLSVPTRPPSERWVRPPDGEVLNRAFQILSRRVAGVEYLIGYEGNAFVFTGNVEEDILSITAVHPMREDAIMEFVKTAGSEWSIVQGLMERGELLEVEYEGKKFYLRKIL